MHNIACRQKCDSAMGPSLKFKGAPYGGSRWELPYLIARMSKFSLAICHMVKVIWANLKSKKEKIVYCPVGP